MVFSSLGYNQGILMLSTMGKSKFNYEYLPKGIVKVLRRIKIDYMRDFVQFLRLKFNFAIWFLFALFQKNKIFPRKHRKVVVLFELNK